MKKLLLFLFCALSVATTQIQASRVVDALDTAFENIATAFTQACNNIDQALHSTDTAFDRFSRGVDRAFNKIDRAVSNMATRVELKSEIVHDHQIVAQCERAFATSAAIGLASAIAGCPLAPLFCTGAKVTGGLLVGAYIKLYVDRAAYKRTELF